MSTDITLAKQINVILERSITNTSFGQTCLTYTVSLFCPTLAAIETSTYIVVNMFLLPTFQRV